MNLKVISAQPQMKCLSSKLLKRTCWWSCLITFTLSSYGNQWMGIGRITSRQTDMLICNRWLDKVQAIQCWWASMDGSYTLCLVKLELSLKNLPLAGQISPSTNKMCQFWELRQGVLHTSASRTGSVWTGKGLSVLITDKFLLCSGQSSTPVLTIEWWWLDTVIPRGLRAESANAVNL